MKTRSLLPYIAGFVLFSASGVSADELHPPSRKAPKQLGQVHFPVSCTPASQKNFDQGVALLHSFWYKEAEKAFRDIAGAEPDCVMAYWGIGMSLYHPLWAPPSAADLAEGASALKEGKRYPRKTDRERDYLGAIGAFYADADRLDHRTRALAFKDAMERLHRTYPEDREAAVFYALALNGTALPTDKSFAQQKKAGRILLKIFQQTPEHPGVAHYLIHSYDYPPLAKDALPAARRYAQIAPDSPHARHMPSHIFIRLGLWQEAIDSNLASSASSGAHAARTSPGAASFEQLHAMDYLVYAYLQTGMDRKAKELVDAVHRIDNVDAEGFAAAYALAAIPARYAIERRDWPAAAALQPHPSRFPWGRFRQYEAITRFARALGLAQTGKREEARKEVEALKEIQKSLVEAKESYWADQVEIQRRAAEGWLARVEGKNVLALERLRAAAELEASTEKHPVTPGAVAPARELLAELFLELDQPAKALREFKAALADTPNRFNALYGAAKAARAGGDLNEARTYYAQLTDLAAHSDEDRPALKEAKAFLKAPSPKPSVSRK